MMRFPQIVLEHLPDGGAASMQQHPLVGDADVEKFADLARVEAQHVAHGHDDALPLGQFVEFAARNATSSLPSTEPSGVSGNGDGTSSGFQCPG